MATTRFTQRINGFVYGYSDINIDINGTIFDEVTALDYTTTIEKGELRGTSPVPAGYTIGYATYKGSMTLSKDQATTFMQLLGDGFAAVPFTITVTFGPTRDSLNVFKTATDVLNGCAIASIDNTHSPGATALQVKFDLVVQDIQYEGGINNPGGIRPFNPNQ
jgi:hypothetical protein